MKFTITILLLSVCTLLFVANAAFAADATSSCGTDPTSGQPVCKLQNPLSVTSPTDLIKTIINAALGIIGALALLMFVWGGFQWFISAGSPEKVKKGSQTMLWAGIGVVAVFASYLILSTFLKYLGGGQ